MIEVPLVDGTIPHQVKGHFGAAKVVLVPRVQARYQSLGKPCVPFVKQPESAIF
ncbi:hypothetical protein LF1_57860 [Rubripirellula obstinata]|uniref:Uncharacterized protein n=1 Tax=Rubripirellula obstinata TaxID=406547 RepID=A0A5B1C743_9BACT|nr:hypothetical protein LF1_57860 [Rubripirellula obstinata]